MITAEELKQIRVKAGWTQDKMAKTLGVSANHLALMERGNKPIERRTQELIDALARKRIDVSYSEALEKWVVAVTTPGMTFAGRQHHLVAAKASKIQAQKVAGDLWDAEAQIPMLIIRDRDR